MLAVNGKCVVKLGSAIALWSQLVVALKWCFQDFMQMAGVSGFSGTVITWTQLFFVGWNNSHKIIVKIIYWGTQGWLFHAELSVLRQQAGQGMQGS